MDDEIKRSWTLKDTLIRLLIVVVSAFLTGFFQYRFSVKPIQEDRTILEKKISSLEKKLSAAKEKITGLYQHIDDKDQKISNLNKILSETDLTAVKKQRDSLNQQIEEKSGKVAELERKIEILTENSIQPCEPSDTALYNIYTGDYVTNDRHIITILEDKIKSLLSQIELLPIKSTEVNYTKMQNDDKVWLFMNVSVTLLRDDEYRISFEAITMEGTRQLKYCQPFHITIGHSSLYSNSSLQNVVDSIDTWFSEKVTPFWNGRE